MEKTLDTLVLLNRTLLLAAATILLIVGGALRQSDESSDLRWRKAQVAQLTAAFQRFKGDSAELYGTAYRPLFAAALKGQPPALQRAFARAEYRPLFLLVGGQRFAFAAPGWSAEPLALLVSLAASAPSGSPEMRAALFPAPELEREDLGRALAAAQRNSIYARYLSAADLVVVLLPEGEGRCRLLFTAESLGDSLSARSLPVRCGEGKGVPAGDVLWAFANSTNPSVLGGTGADQPPAEAVADLLYRPWPEALARVDAAAEAAGKRVDDGSTAAVELAGVSADRSLAMLVAPVLLVAVLLMMAVSTSVAARLQAYEPLEGGFWWAQFLGRTAWLSPLVTLLLTLAAILLGTMFSLNGRLPGPGPLRIACGLMLAAILLYGEVMLVNRQMALQWQRRMAGVRPPEPAADAGTAATASPAKRAFRPWSRPAHR